MKIRIPAAASLAVSLLALAPAGLAAHPPDAPRLETLAAFNPVALETPENLAFDRDGNLYLSLALTGEIRRIAPDGTQSTGATTSISTSTAASTARRTRPTSSCGSIPTGPRRSC